MTVYNLGSINADYFYQVGHIPAPGETIAATDLTRGLGGKGANQSVALSHAGTDVCHIGAVGADGDWMLQQLNSLGLETDFIEKQEIPSGHAIITVAADGENAITLFKGANHEISDRHIQASLAEIGSDDWLVLQNETNGQSTAIAMAKAAGAKVVYSAAPFVLDDVKRVLPEIDVLAVNETEAKQLLDALGLGEITDLPLPELVMTLGAKGAVYHELGSKTKIQTDPIQVDVIDTTGAGDTFIGYFIGRLDAGDSVQDALHIANNAAALKVTRAGTADAIPTLDDVRKFMD